VQATGRESSLVSLKRERSDVDLSQHGGSAKPADADRDDAQRIADKRKGELRLCVEIDERGPSAAEKMSRCACPLMQRWRFPKREAKEALGITITVHPKLAAVALSINAKGVVDACGLVASGPPSAGVAPAEQGSSPRPPPPRAVP
jgi:hypothetical protein